MTTTDLLLVIALSIFAISWWLPRWPHQRLVLAACATISVAAGIAGVLDHRWQDAVGTAVAGILLMALLLGRMRNKSSTTGLPWLSGSAVALLLLMSIAPLYLFPVTDLPPPSGKYPVGSRDFELVDPHRLGVFAAQPTEARRLLIRTWYPAGDIAGLTPRPYFTDAEVRSTVIGLGQMIGAPFLFQYTKHSLTNSYTDAPLVAHAENLPVVFYSHGYTSFAGQNTALMEELASHGYVVYSVQHSYDSAPTLFPDGDVLPTDPALVASASEPPVISDAFKQAYAGTTLDDRYQGHLQIHREMREDGERIARSAPVWLADRLFVLDALQGGQVPDSVRELVAASNFSATGQMGMSFGGSTSGGLCMIDPRCVAGVNLDGGDYHNTPFGNNLPVPFMMFYADFKGIAEWTGAAPDSRLRGSNDFSYERPELAGLRDDIYRPMTRDVKHLGLSDFTLFTRNPVRQNLFGSIDADTIIQIQNDFVRGFFDTHLRGSEVGFPDRQYQRYANQVERTNISDIRQWWLSKHPEDTVQRIVLETSLGEIEVALYPNRAPAAVTNFLAYVDAGFFDDSSFYRATGRARGHAMDILQGGLLAKTVASGPEAYSEVIPLIPAIAHETTAQTGIANERGTIAYARLAPGTASSEFFFNLRDNPVLNTGDSSHTDGQGYTAFGRVMRGMRVLERIQSMATEDAAEIAALSGQLLTQPVAILRVYRLSAEAPQMADRIASPISREYPPQ